jgi:hypothetical protein
MLQVDAGDLERYDDWLQMKMEFRGRVLTDERFCKFVAMDGRCWGQVIEAGTG